MILHRSIRSLSIALSALALSAAPLKAQFIDFKNGGTLLNGNALSGTVESEGWNDLTTTRLGNSSPAGPGNDNARAIYRPYGSRDNTNGWYIWEHDGFGWIQGDPSTIASNVGEGTSTLWKKEGYGYIGSSLHQGVSSNDIAKGGTFQLNVTSIDDLKTVILQIQVTNRTTPDGKIVFDSLPVLIFGDLTLEADFGDLFAREVDFINNPSFPERNQDRDYYAFQWDLSGYEITGDFIIEWTGLTNSGIYGLQLDQSDTFVQVVPEPTSIALLAAGAGALLWRRKFRRAA